MAPPNADLDSTASDDAPDAYRDLMDRYARISHLESGSGVLYWDQQVTMPTGGTAARGKQLAALSATTHEKLTGEGIADALDAAEDAGLDGDRTANVREIRRRHERNRSVPEELVEELTEQQSASQQVWKEAKADDDFDRFAPTLETLRDLHVERAEAIDPDRPAYEVMYEDGEPYLPLERLEEVFEELKAGLVPLIEEIEAADVDLASPFVAAGPYDDATQRDLSESVLDLLNYPDDRGRLDVSAHPFTSGNQFDARITTRFKPEDPMDAFTATVHEFGHASYELGLPDGRFGEPLGASLSSGVHESQSRFWENHVARTEPFWEGFVDEANDHLGTDATAREAYEAVNQIYPENLIRVEADELTYHLHIILRCEIDRAFVEGDVSVEEIPAVWNEKMDDYLGVVPDTDADGCLQDIHWSSRFAAFQGYTIGSVLAAQLDHAMREDLGDVDALIREGDLQPLWEWMTEHVHRHGRRYPTDELVEVATGEPLTAEYFLDYVEEKFGELYDL
ncbi:carboxypeptidase M32 [Halobaculum roseum]|uniref:Metal-dependent carboxypeptidase n=1 Tax=Halobaculum roseum TaxID=2175149 RepID=A0ABD5MPA2_9EURY|nr:carboxypeptidase M32 [Halobaculum roseum]QZY02036.1 carboxypeptidase M32 [Halobaculum roseum]